MRTYVSPIGYDSRRVTRPVLNTGLGPDDEVYLLRPERESDTERATQAVADVEQMLQEIEPEVTITITRIATDSFESTVIDCCDLIATLSADPETIISLGGGARDILLPLTIASVTLSKAVDRTLFFSDLDGNVQNWTLPQLTARIPDKASTTFETIVRADNWLSLSELTTQTDQSKSTVIRHVQELADAGVIETESREQSKYVRVSFSGELRWIANQEC